VTVESKEEPLSQQHPAGLNASLLQVLGQRQSLEAARTRGVVILLAVLPLDLFTVAAMVCYVVIGGLTVVLFTVTEAQEAKGSGAVGQVDPQQGSNGPEISALIDSNWARLNRATLLQQLSIALLVLEIVIVGLNASRVS
jgi:hypothetical protein